MRQAPPPSGPPPAILLVRPQMGENIGAAARAMMNFGLSELRLVAPRDGWPNARALDMAAAAAGIIEQAKVYPDLAEATADLHFLAAATARPRELALPSATPEEAASALAEKAQAGSRAALVFGPERSGLSTAEVAHCRMVVTIPTHAANASLNLAQSVAILAYAWWRKTGGADGAPARPPAAAMPPPAAAAELDVLHRHLMRALEDAEYFTAPNRKPAVSRNLRALLARAGLTSREAESLHGIVQAIGRGASRQDR